VKEIEIEYDLLIVKPDIAGNEKQIVILGELVKYDPVGRPSGKYIRLGMTVADAMRLLALLKDVQKQLGLPDELPHVQSMQVPPRTDRN